MTPKRSLVVGFTGTRIGMTIEQRGALARTLDELAPTEAHHGDCVGADAEFAKLVNERLPPEAVHVHPPKENRLRALANVPGNMVHEVKHYLDRNEDIVDACDVLVAAPKSDNNVEGGTGFTIRYARRVGRPRIILSPTGTALREGPPVKARTKP
jgi:hypothetical protein